MNATGRGYTNATPGERAGVGESSLDVNPSIASAGAGGLLGDAGRSLLTARELMALLLVVRGYSSDQVATMLQTTAETVEVLVRRATDHLDATDPEDAVSRIFVQRMPCCAPSRALARFYETT
jgi:DNA-binding CsgD family transcriptional regulator